MRATATARCSRWRSSIPPWATAPRSCSTAATASRWTNGPARCGWSAPARHARRAGCGGCGRSPWAWRREGEGGARLPPLLQTRGLLQERRKPRALPLDKGHDPIMRILLATCLALLACLAPVRAADAPPTVFAAASLKESMDEAAAAFRRGTGREIRVSYSGSSALARQIEQGAPAVVLVAADLGW